MAKKFDGASALDLWDEALRLPVVSKLMLWPAFKFKVAVELEKENVDPFRKAVLGMYASGERKPEKIAESLCLDADLVKDISFELASNNEIDAAGMLTEKGMQSAASGMLSSHEVVTLLLFRDAWSGRLYSLGIDQKASSAWFTRVEQGQNVVQELDLKAVRVSGPANLDYSGPPSVLEAKNALNNNVEQKRQGFARNLKYGWALPEGFRSFRVLMVDPEPEPVLLKCGLTENQFLSDRLWTALHPVWPESDEGNGEFSDIVDHASSQVVSLREALGGFETTLARSPDAVTLMRTAWKNAGLKITAVFDKGLPTSILDELLRNTFYHAELHRLIGDEHLAPSDSALFRARLAVEGLSAHLNESLNEDGSARRELSLVFGAFERRLVVTRTNGDKKAQWELGEEMIMARLSKFGFRMADLGVGDGSWETDCVGLGYRYVKGRRSVAWRKKESWLEVWFLASLGRDPLLGEWILKDSEHFSRVANLVDSGDQVSHIERRGQRKKALSRLGPEECANNLMKIFEAVLTGRGAI